VSGIRVRIAQHAVAKGYGELVAPALGSCVAIALHDASVGVGGLAHVLLPSSVGYRGGRPAKFVDTAVTHLLDEMAALGAGRTIVAKLAGGASMFATLLGGGGVNVGARNVEAARRALADAGVPIVGEDVGGEHGRTVALQIRSGRLAVRSLTNGDVEL